MKKRGKGIACTAFGIGSTGWANPASAVVEMLLDGSIQVLTGAAEIGQGSDTVLAQIVAEVLATPLNQIKIVSGDTAATPEAGTTSASRQTYISGNAVRLASLQVKEILTNVACPLLDIPPELLVFEDGKAFCPMQPQKFIRLTELAQKCRIAGRIPVGYGSFNPPFVPMDPETGQGAPFQAHTFGAQVAEVEVDTETGEVQVLHVWASYDIGKAINPATAEGQIEGGIVQGLGQVLLEEMILEKGQTLTDSFATYLLPTSQDTPEISIQIIEESEPTGPFGAKGLGEPALAPTLGAVANAITDAIGVPITELPITPERILTAIKSTSKKQMAE